MNILRRLRLSNRNNIEELDDPKTTMLRKKIILKKIFLRNIYIDFYMIFRNSLTDLPKKRTLVEIGSGGGFIKKIIPDVITSDVLKVSDIDMQFSAVDMPFKNRSIDRFFMINTLHHIHNAQTFFKEVDRCLKKNGKLIMIDMANTMWGRFVYQNFHYEAFNPKGNWILKSQRPLSESNGALAWIIFIRDRKKFERLFPDLTIKRITPHTPVRYLVSGGLTHRQILPSSMYTFVKNIEDLLSPFNRYIGMFYTIEIDKQA